MNPKRLQIIAWSLSVLVTVLAVVAWGQGNRWHFAGMSTYQLFPLFGLLAFSVMWSHYIAAVLRMYFKIEKSVLSHYFETTSLVVLGAILLHPGLLAWQLWRDGLGLPPGSELHYVASDVRVYALLGMISLLLFLAFEFHRKFGDRPWWKFISSGSDAAMILIFIHSLKLGGQLQTGWLRVVWYFYGVTLIGSLGYIYYKKFQPKSSASL